MGQLLTPDYVKYRQVTAYEYTYNHGTRPNLTAMRMTLNNRKQLPIFQRFAIITFCSLFLAPSTSAYTFAPTEIEWQMWPEYCKARYVTTNIGGRSKWASMVPRALGEKWRAAFGHESFIVIHHYCAGLAYFARGQKELDSGKKVRLFKQSISESSFSFIRTTPGSKLYSQIAVAIGMAHEKLENFEDAEIYFNRAIANNANYDGSYAALALMRKRQDRIAEAISTLEQGNDALDGQSAEIHYHLGSLYFDNEEYDASVKHARSAYMLGYPLPGLRNRLKRQGLWPAPDKNER